MTASTGLAAVAVGGTTLHAFFGISDGRYTDDEIIHKIRNNIDYKRIRDGIISTDTLIIDEVSMISRNVFLQIEVISRRVREKSLPFGGMQVILAVDLITAVHELSQGLDCSNGTKHMVKSLARPLPHGERPMKLFALNYDVEKVNSDCLLNMNGVNKTERFQERHIIEYPETVFRGQQPECV
ncbi:hypothetical protein BSL78_20689 [Apostichopus japonicus]|uniref:ATP-dependent DNA helicase n=1 Tax=Stichopus japonicus TaxID=307972 RepID=A0A2G8K3A0_STIJA|nr:hypothetical protein BSL78_20689 [Apostichopus japonicus]